MVRTRYRTTTWFPTPVELNYNSKDCLRPRVYESELEDSSILDHFGGTSIMMSLMFFMHIQFSETGFHLPVVDLSIYHIFSIFFSGNVDSSELI